MSKRKLIISLILWALMTVTLFASIDDRMVIRRYTVQSDHVEQPIRLAVLTDLHGCDYGEEYANLLAAVEAEAPDAILLVGDMFSADGQAEDELTLLRALNGIAFTCYVTGNHEHWEYNVPALTSRIAETGVTVLEASSVSLSVRDQNISLCGIPDPYAGGVTEDYLTAAAADAAEGAFTILLAHRPELIGKYAATGDFDLVVSGHAHGGQVRIPLLVNGLYAPNQGFFPKYAGGRYDVDGTTLIVSRGLSTQKQMGIPRVFNRPELVIVEIN